MPSVPSSRPHQLVYISWKSRLNVIYHATRQHAINLAKFVSLYKIFLLIQKKSNGGKERSADTFVAGLLGGYLVFGNRTAVNEQVGIQLPTSFILIPHQNPHADCTLCSLTCCSLFHSAVQFPILHICFSTEQSVQPTSPTRFPLFLIIRSLVMGSSNVAVQE